MRPTETAAPTTSPRCCCSAWRPRRAARARQVDMRYRVASGSLTVQARSKLHNTTTVWSRITGEIPADADTLATAGAVASFAIDMTAFDAGDFLKNRKLRSDFELARYPT